MREDALAAAFLLQRCIAVEWLPTVRRAHSNGLIYLSLARGRGVAAPVALSLSLSLAARSMTRMGHALLDNIKILGHVNMFVSMYLLCE